MIKQKSKTKPQLVRELKTLRARVRALEKSQRDCQRIEETLHEADRFREEVIAGAGAGIIVYDCKFRYVVWNRRMENLTGIPAADVLGKNAFDLFPHLRQQGVDRLLHQALAGETVTSSDTPYYAPQTGKSGWVVGTYAPHRDTQGNIIGVIAMIYDITQRKQVEEALQKSEQYARSIVDSSIDMIVTVDNQRRIVEFNRAAQQTFGYTREEVLGKHINILYADAVEGQEIHRVAFENGQTVQEVLNQRKNGEVFRSQLSAAALRDANGVPVGVIGVSRDITERKRVEDTLRESEERFRRAFDYAAIGMALVAPDGRWLKVNRALCQLVGYSEQDLLTRTFQDITHPDDLDPDLALMQRMLTGEIDTYQLEKRYFHKQGHIVWVLLSVSLVRDARGQPLHFISQIQNITARKLTENALKESEEKYRDLFENANDFIQVIDSDGRFLYVNRAWKEALGYNDEETAQLSLFDIVTPDSRSHCQDLFRRVLTGEKIDRIEVKFVARDGRQITVEGCTNCKFVDGKPVSTRGIFRDITDRKRVEEELALERNLLRTLIDSLPEAIYVKDVGSRYIISNLAHLRLAGASIPEDMVGKTPFDFFPRDLAMQFVAEDQNVIQTGEPLIDKEEETIDHASGLVSWQLVGKVPLRDSQGKIIGLVGVGRDITERKRIEEQVLREKVRFQQLFENSPIGIAMLDDHDCIQSTNPAFQAIFQYSAAEVVGCPIKDVIVPDTRREEAAQLSSEVLNGVAVHRETIRRRKDGTLVPVEVYGVPIKLDEKSIGLYGMYADISELKGVEEKLKREVERLGALHEIDRALATLNLDACMQTIVQRARALFASDLVDILLLRDDHLRLVAEAGLVSTVSDIAIPSDRGISGWCASHRQSVRVADVSQDERYISYDARTRAEMVAPLVVQDDCIGVLNVESAHVDAFTAADLELLESLAARAATAIHNARLHTAEREHRQFAETLRDIGMALTSKLDSNAVLDLLLDHVQSVVPYDSATVLLLDDNVVRCKRQRGYEKLGLLEWIRQFEAPLTGLASLAKIAETGQPYVVPDTHSDPNWTFIEQSRHIRSWMGAPIKIRGTLIGFLALDKVEPGFYTNKMAERLAAFAGQAGLALENARLYAEQQKLAVTDSLTGLFNRRHFVTLAQREFQRARRQRVPFAVLMLDLDDFKKVNDTFGHSIGDQALQLVARALAQTVRSIDIVARYGGDEFVVLLPDCNRRSAQHIVARLQDQISALRLTTNSGDIEFRISIGAAIAALTPEETLDMLLARADTEMYQEKQAAKALRLAV